MTSTLQAKYKIESYSHAVTVGANTYTGNTFTETEDGWYPIGIVGFACGNANVLFSSVRLTNRAVGTAEVQLTARNVSGSQTSPNCVYQILWAK